MSGDTEIWGVDYIDPDWAGATRVHDWRNYISDELRSIWSTFTPEQKRVIAENADVPARAEIWE